MIQVKNLTVNRGGKNIIAQLDHDFVKGKFTSILGPNGSGKTTLLKAISGLIPYSGQVEILGQDLSKMKITKRADNMAILPQVTHLNSDLSVFEIVSMGRFYKSQQIFQSLSNQDEEIITHAMEMTEIKSLKDRKFLNLSGGEKQRVLLARALAQQPKVLLLDEPTASLDINYQIEILKLLKKLQKKTDLTIICVLHDIQLAAEFSQQILLLNDGRVIDVGKPHKIINPENIRRTFNINSHVYWDSFREKLTLIPIEKEQQPDKFLGKIHIIAGGGSAGNILEVLRHKNCEISMGVINVGDSDWQKCKELNIKTITVQPYSPITEEAYKQNTQEVLKSDFIIFCHTPIGNGNLKNLKALQLANQNEKTIIIVEGEQFTKRDFTDGGEGSKIYDELTKCENVFKVQNVNELFNILEVE
ncbi:ABC transporter ATP-binding protein [Proteinivorax hydrogeniformans]|uniref:ABC transporter ATP-binding protein n=1 Tax=Proteinivorax hydrogeniformans TaxID=1826727 RepID=A0AAU8HWN3_9FIRM